MSRKKERKKERKKCGRMGKRERKEIETSV
jgi:hypothetical protein